MTMMGFHCWNAAATSGRRSRVLAAYASSHTVVVSNRFVPRQSSIHHCRNFSVRGLPWCAPGGGAKTAQKDQYVKPPAQCGKDANYRLAVQAVTMPFGVMAAQSRNRVIGVQGGLPWNLPTDYATFCDVTRGKILILGRKTFGEVSPAEETTTSTSIYDSHLTNAMATIVVSKTVAQRPPKQSANDTRTLLWVESFSDALQEAERLLQEVKNDQTEQGLSTTTTTTVSNNTNPSVPPQFHSVDCWIAGGERLYEEALLHPACKYVHLTTVDTEIDFTDKKKNNNKGQGGADTDDSNTQQQQQQQQQPNDVAYFPPKHRWDYLFDKQHVIDVTHDALNYSVMLYQNIYTKNNGTGRTGQ